MYRICIIGDRESVIGFMALGFSVYEADDSSAAGEILKTLAKDKENAVIFIVENYAVELRELIDKYKDLPLPAIVPVPGKEGSSGYGMENIRRATERAVGADILFKDKH